MLLKRGCALVWRVDAMNEPRPLLVGTRVAAAMLDLDEDRVRDLIRRGTLQAVRIASREGGPARKLRVSVASIEAYVSNLIAQQCDERIDARDEAEDRG